MCPTAPPSLRLVLKPSPDSPMPQTSGLKHAISGPVMSQLIRQSGLSSCVWSNSALGETLLATITRPASPVLPFQLCSHRYSEVARGRLRPQSLKCSTGLDRSHLLSNRNQVSVPVRYSSLGNRHTEVYLSGRPSEDKRFVLCQYDLSAWSGG